jgi:aryl-alcohol dehydrogenase-like predicted oxidoreductase
MLGERSRRKPNRIHADESGISSNELLNIWLDLETDIEQSAKAMHDLYQAGKIRAIGISNFDVKQMENFSQIAPLYTLQPPYHLLRRTKGSVISVKRRTQSLCYEI